MNVIFIELQISLENFFHELIENLPPSENLLYNIGYYGAYTHLEGENVYLSVVLSLLCIYAYTIYLIVLSKIVPTIRNRFI